MHESRSHAWSAFLGMCLRFTGSAVLSSPEMVGAQLMPVTHTTMLHTCRYGFGVGGEYPMASASAAERSQEEPNLRSKRGQQVVLTFSQQVGRTT